MHRFAFLRLLPVLVLLPLCGRSAEPPIDPQLGAPLRERGRPSLGAAEAPVVVIQVSSFKCGHCRMFHEQVFPVLRRDFVDTGAVRWVTLDASPELTDVDAAVFRLGRCAQRQGSYWEAQGFLYQHGQRSSSHLYGRLGSQSAFDGAVLLRCARGNGVDAEIAADFKEAIALGIRSLPTFILRRRETDGTFTETRLEGFTTQARFREALTALLGDANAPTAATAQ